jgi:hypothetical protein
MTSVIAVSGMKKDSHFTNISSPMLKPLLTLNMVYDMRQRNLKLPVKRRISKCRKTGPISRCLILELGWHGRSSSF